jgi:hypothetical protein
MHVEIVWTHKKSTFHRREVMRGRRLTVMYYIVIHPTTDFKLAPFVTLPVHSCQNSLLQQTYVLTATQERIEAVTSGVLILKIPPNRISGSPATMHQASAKRADRNEREHAL